MYKGHEELAQRERWENVLWTDDLVTNDPRRIMTGYEFFHVGCEVQLEPVLGTQVGSIVYSGCEEEFGNFASKWKCPVCGTIWCLEMP